MNAENLTQMAAYQLRAQSRKWACAKVLPSEFGERIITLDNRKEVHIYLPCKDKIPELEGQATEVADDDTDDSP
jgi:hypothetical protein